MRPRRYGIGTRGDVGVASYNTTAFCPLIFYEHTHSVHRWVVNFMIIVSACLAGLHCRYDGGAKPNEEVMALVEQGEAMLVCPEQTGGLITPRPPSEIESGTGEDVLSGRARVKAKDGADVTEQFLAGARKTLDAARACGAEHAILKANSPSCGCGLVYDGTFSGTLKEGNGVAAALLLQEGISVETR